MVNSAGYYLADANYYQTLLQDLYDGIVGLSVGDSATSPSDGYRQAIYRDTEMGGNQHLEVWIGLLGLDSVAREAVRQRCTLTCTYREQLDDDALSQARIQGSIRQLVEHLLGWAHHSGARVAAVTRTSDPLTIGDGWCGVGIDFTLTLPRGR